MLRKDNLLFQFEKLGRALAKALGLKQQGVLNEAYDLIDDVLESHFGLSIADLYDLSETEFEQYLKRNNYAAQELDILAQLLYNSKGADENAAPLLHKILIVFDAIEKTYKTTSLENLNRASSIKERLASSR